jgi:putative ABC transport system substrate-binding protein
MKRRAFITLLGGAAAVWPLAARAQQPGKVPVIGFLGAATPLARSQWVAAFVQRLRELGWIGGRTVTIEYRWAEGRNERFAEIAAEFVRLKVDVIVTFATPPVIAAKEATAVIPIVSAVMGDPVGTGLVASLARPGGNVTGLSNQAADVAGKRLELLREVVPGLRRLAVLANVSNPISGLEIGEVQAAAKALGLDVVTLGNSARRRYRSCVRDASLRVRHAAARIHHLAWQCGGGMAARGARAAADCAGDRFPRSRFGAVRRLSCDRVSARLE